MDQLLLVVGAAIAASAVALTRDVRSKPQLVCATCGGRELTRLGFVLWTGVRRDGKRFPGARTDYRCDGCGARLFAESGTPPMTEAQHRAWRDAAFNGAVAPPRAVVHRRRRWWR